MYSITKKEQDKFSELNIFNYPKIINIKPGLIDTTRVKSIDGKKLITSQVVQILDMILLRRSEGIIIGSITFGY